MDFLREKQKELKVLEVELKKYRNNINQVLSFIYF